MSPADLIVIGIIAFAVLVALIYGLYRRSQRRLPVLTRVGTLRENQNYKIVPLPKAPEFKLRSLTLEQQSSAWRKYMTEIGTCLRDSGVRSIIFTHGSFAGDDPLGISGILKAIYPQFNPKLERQIRELIKRQGEKLAKDCGNFPKSYLRLCEQAMGIPCRGFQWSSENHHLARLRGARFLIHELAQAVQDGELDRRDRVLLIAHSHGGNLLCLMTHILMKSKLALLLRPALANIDPIETLARECASLRRLHLDMVTLGTPYRYDWPTLPRNFRLLHIINHRGDPNRTESIRGILHTRFGDYIQQLGIIGSDLRAPLKIERRANEDLDPILGPGRNLKLWSETRKLGQRIPPQGQVLLVDYGDDARGLPNCTQTLFGHGTYTRYRYLAANMRLIEHALYS